MFVSQKRLLRQHRSYSEVCVLRGTSVVLSKSGRRQAAAGDRPRVCVGEIEASAQVQSIEILAEDYASAGASSIGAARAGWRARVPRYAAEIVELFLGKPCVLSRQARNRPDAHPLLACNGPDALACVSGGSDRLSLGYVIRDGCGLPSRVPSDFALNNTAVKRGR